MERNALRIPFNTTFESGSDTKTVVDAITEVDTRTGKPTKVTSDVTKPLIDTSQAGKVGVSPTSVDFKTVGTHRSLIGNFTTIVVITTVQAETDGLAVVLCISCKGQTHYSD